MGDGRARVGSVGSQVKLASTKSSRRGFAGVIMAEGRDYELLSSSASLPVQCWPKKPAVTMAPKAKGSGGTYATITVPALTVAVAIAAFLHGVNHTTTFNGIFPIVIEAIQHIGSALLGRTPKDESMFQYGEDGLPLCNGCHCTPEWDEDPNTFKCPVEQPPPWQYDVETIDILKSHEANNPFVLDCNPYETDDCDTMPSLQRGIWSKDAVCGLVYDSPEEVEGSSAASSSGCQLSNYTLQTFRNEEDAKKTANAIITHMGHCGACSTTKDLAAYMTHPDMVAEGRKCTNRALLSQSWGRSCYEALGFTTPCATIWAHNSINTATICRATCVRHLFSPANGPEPECKLNDCLHCDEIQSGPNFQLFAGRTRRNSGLRTPIMRQCKGFAGIEHEACPSLGANTSTSTNA